MKIYRKTIGIICIMVLLLCMAACATSRTSSTTEPQSSSASDSMQKSETKSKILVAYFSATGNTRSIAETIAEFSGGDLFEIIPTEDYSDEDLNYNDGNCRASKEQNDRSVRPEILGMVENMEQYDIVLIGHPIWWGEEPRIMDTFMESYDFSGKTVVNFCTSGGSEISTATDNLKELSPSANWFEGHRFETDASSSDVQAWLNELNILN